MYPNWSNFGHLLNIYGQIWSKPGNSTGKRPFPGSHFPFSRREMCNSSFDNLGKLFWFRSLVFPFHLFYLVKSWENDLKEMRLVMAYPKTSWAFTWLVIKPVGLVHRPKKRTWEGEEERRPLKANIVSLKAQRNADQSLLHSKLFLQMNSSSKDFHHSAEIQTFSCPV